MAAQHATGGTIFAKGGIDLSPRMTTYQDAIAVARELQSTLDGFNEPSLFASVVMQSLELLNKDESLRKVAGTDKLFLHAEQGFAIDTDEGDFDVIETLLGKSVDVVLKGTLRDVVWLGDVAVGGFAARMVDVRVYETDGSPTRTNHPMVVPVNDIRSYLPAA